MGRYQDFERAVLSGELVEQLADGELPVGPEIWIGGDGAAEEGKEEAGDHHIVMRMLGGDDRWENLLTLCDRCHLQNIHESGSLAVTGAAPSGLTFAEGADLRHDVTDLRRGRRRSSRAVPTPRAPQPPTRAARAP